MRQFDFGVLKERQRSLRIMAGGNVAAGAGSVAGFGSGIDQVGAEAETKGGER
jgi:hypothetical protein